MKWVRKTPKVYIVYLRGHDYGYIGWSIVNDRKRVAFPGGSNIKRFVARLLSERCECRPYDFPYVFEFVCNDKISKVIDLLMDVKYLKINWRDMEAMLVMPDDKLLREVEVRAIAYMMKRRR